MALVKFSKKTEKIRKGKHVKLPKQGNKLYHTTRFGEDRLSNYPIHRDPATISAKQKASCDQMAQAQAAADADRADPIKLEQWLQKRNSDPVAMEKYKTLRGYIIAQYRQLLQNGE